MADVQSPVSNEPVQPASDPVGPPVLPAIVVRVTPIPPNIQEQISDGLKYGPAAVYRHMLHPHARD